MDPVEYEKHLENEVDRLARERVALLREIVAGLSKVVDAIPERD